MKARLQRVLQWWKPIHDRLAKVDPIGFDYLMAWGMLFAGLWLEYELSVALTVVGAVNYAVVVFEMLRRRR